MWHVDVTFAAEGEMGCSGGINYLGLVVDQFAFINYCSKLRCREKKLSSFTANAGVLAIGTSFM